MGEYVRERVLRALGLARVFVQLEALNTRLKRMEQDVLALQQQPRSQTIPASPPPPVAVYDHRLAALERIKRDA